MVKHPTGDSCEVGVSFHLWKGTPRSKLEGEKVMTATAITDRDRRLAELCLHCTACKTARRKQKGFVYNFVKQIEGGICPACRAYAKVYGRKAHEPIPPSE